MKKETIFAFLYQLASPALLMVLGLILLVNPDLASSILGKILGWGACAVGGGLILSAFFGPGRAGRLVSGLAALASGGFLLANPLWIVASLGRILGFIVLLRGLRDLFLARQWGHGRILAAITTAIGLVLLVLPLTTSRLVFSLCGLVLLIIGAAMLADRLKDRRYLTDSGKQNIIDAL